MDLRYLQYIVEIGNESNISKAAKKLFVSQPTLSVYLARLEDDLGMPLFSREQNRLVPTEAGKLYLETASEMLEMKDDLYSKIAALKARNSDILSVGIFQITGSRMITSVYPEFIARFPDVRVDITDARFQVICSRLMDGSFDLGFFAVFRMASESLHYELLKREDFVLAVSSRNSLTAPFMETAGGALPLVSITLFRKENFILAPEDTIRREVENFVFSQHNLIPKMHSSVHNIHTLMDMVENNLGIAIIPKCQMDASRDIVYFSLEEKPFWNIVAAYRKDAPLTGCKRAFIDLANSYYATHDSNV